MLKQEGEYLTYIQPMLATLEPEELSPEEKNEVISLYYNDPLVGHLGTDKTIELITRNHYWKGIRKDIE